MIRGLTLGEWIGVLDCRVRIWLCGLRGHPWGPWEYEVPPEEGYGMGVRLCRRCEAYEERRPA